MYIMKRVPAYTVCIIGIYICTIYMCALYIYALYICVHYIYMHTLYICVHYIYAHTIYICALYICTLYIYVVSQLVSQTNSLPHTMTNMQPQRATWPSGVYQSPMYTYIKDKTCQKEVYMYYICNRASVNSITSINNTYM